MSFEPCCETCKYCESEKYLHLTCVNENADEWYEDVTWNHSCPLWEERDEGCKK